MLLLFLKICFYVYCIENACSKPTSQCLYSCLIWLQTNWNQTLGKDFKLQKHQKCWCTKPWGALHKLNIMQFYKYCYCLLLLKALLILKQLELKYVYKRNIFGHFSFLISLSPARYLQLCLKHLSKLLPWKCWCSHSQHRCWFKPCWQV